MRWSQTDNIIHEVLKSSTSWPNYIFLSTVSKLIPSNSTTNATFISYYFNLSSFFLIKEITIFNCKYLVILGYPSNCCAGSKLVFIYVRPQYLYNRQLPNSYTCIIQFIFRSKYRKLPRNTQNNHMRLSHIQC